MQQHPMFRHLNPVVAATIAGASSPTAPAPMPEPVAPASEPTPSSQDSSAEGEAPRESQLEIEVKPAKPSEPIVQFFHHTHLPVELAMGDFHDEINEPFADLAHAIVETIPRNPERTEALRFLLQAKEAAVRARMMK